MLYVKLSKFIQNNSYRRAGFVRIESNVQITEKNILKNPKICYTVYMLQVAIGAKIHII